MPQNKKTQQSLLSSRVLLVTMRWALVAAWTGVALVVPGDFDTAAIVLRFGVYITLSFLFANALWQHIPLKYACVAAFIYAVLAATFSTLLLPSESTSTNNLTAFAILVCAAAIGSVIAHPLLQRIDSLISSRKK
ncbi:MAG: hypothetical protein VB027_04865 [Gordonibacter sp.]|nr:hypothetical protein [Gordonibacter sp.]